MNHKILRLLWPPRRLLGVVVGMMGVVLLVVSVAGASNGPPPKVPGYVAGVSKVSSSNDTKQPAPQPTAQQNNTPAASSQKQTNTSQTQNTTTTQTNTAPPPNTQPSTIEVSLTVNKAYKGKVSLLAGSNQCDVLQQALKDGMISSLTMKYISALQSYGVYVIDGIGDTNEVWWTYEVDGKGPPVGCNRVTAQQGNSIEWDYVKN